MLRVRFHFLKGLVNSGKGLGTHHADSKDQRVDVLTKALGSSFKVERTPRLFDEFEALMLLR